MIFSKPELLVYLHSGRVNVINLAPLLITSDVTHQLNSVTCRGKSSGGKKCWV